MWSRRAALRLVIGGAALGLAAALAGCGFRPLYGNRTPGGGATGNVSVDQQLAGIRIKVIVRNYGALARSDLSATRRNVELNAFYSLSDSAGNVVLTDTSQINTGYDEFDDPLNDITANEHAQERAALQMAEMIKTRIAAFFAQNTAHVAQ
jgi:LPS-assembly lipoprotein